MADLSYIRNNDILLVTMNKNDDNMISKDFIFFPLLDSAYLKNCMLAVTSSGTWKCRPQKLRVLGKKQPYGDTKRSLKSCLDKMTKR